MIVPKYHPNAEYTTSEFSKTIFRSSSTKLSQPSFDPISLWFKPSHSLPIEWRYRCRDICGHCSIPSPDTVQWLYRPWAIRWRAKMFLPPEDFLTFARLFWNQIFICPSERFNVFASSSLRCSVRYWHFSNSTFSLCSCSLEKAVLGLLSSCGDFSFFLIFLDLGPVW